MQSSVGLLFSVLSLLLGAQGSAHSGHCAGKHCFALYRNTTDFETARNHCKSAYGDLMTVRSEEFQNIVSDLLANLTGQYWIGIRAENGACSDNSTASRGYRWISGDGASDFYNWGKFASSSCSSCVSFSAADKLWMEQPCNDKVEGFLCEYSIQHACKPLRVSGNESVMYQAYYGFEVKDLSSLPMGTIAINRTSGGKSMCFDKWTPAPWGCEVANGGCDYKCSSKDMQSACECPPGKTVHINKVSCRQHHPCDKCEHLCTKKQDSFVCACPQGHALGEDGKCTDIDECADVDAPCPLDHTTCVNTKGGFECPCQNGYVQENDQCVRENPCSSGPCEHNCVATTGGNFTCSCRAGFSVSKDDPTRCDRVCSSQECRTECDRNTHQCRCPKGYMSDQRDGHMFCIDIDECETECDIDQKCTNTYGGFSCSCYEGYFLTNNKCEKSPSSTSPYFSTASPPAGLHPSERPSEAGVASVLGITCMVLIGLVMLAILVRTYYRHCCGKFEVNLKSKGDDIHYLQQVTTEKYKKLPFDGQVNLTYET